MPSQPRPIAERARIDRATFEAEIVPAAQPVVLRGQVTDWPLVAAARQSDADFAAALRAMASGAAGEAWFGAPAIEGRFGFTDDLTGHNFDRRLATVDQLLDLILRQRGDAAPWSVYAGALPVAKHVPQFRATHPMPLIDADRYMLVSLWLGNRTKTAAHWDLPQNLACVLAGRRRFTLFPTDQVANLYVGPIDFTLAGQPSSLADIEAPDFDRYPRFAEAFDHALVAELDPGDVLYVPSLWWHAVTGLEPLGAMINYWWRDGPARMMTPMLSLKHALMTMRGLPANEKAAWRAMFDHYLFGDDPAAHLPDHARGVLGDLSPEAQARLMAELAAALRR
ncbi:MULTISPECIES: cupin-like domain-containing protein [Sphingomonas]|uniref:cupin-like domain-containing protein n=1 Tax=Sphingomonas TaxID=13687 RepID=UPI000835D505|nr:cupin-like domain-containing protein [Sphingomonas sp. CCH10-B3]